MKIAAVTAEGSTIHAHFGQAPYFEVLTIEEGKIVSREPRAKPSHTGHHAGDGPRAHQHASGDSHAAGMAAIISDCQVVLARGMGEPAYYALRAAGVEPILVQEQTVDEAVQAYLRGELQHHSERMHRH